MQIRVWLLVLGLCHPALAQNLQPTNDTERTYFKVVTERADKIVGTLKLEDAAKAARVRGIIAQQYFDLSKLHEVQKSGQPIDTELARLHTNYLAKLSRELTREQVDQVKDGMTYGVVQLTYNGYLKMLPELT